MKTLAERYNINRAKLLGHIIRADEEDPLRVVALENDRPWPWIKEGIGLPRQDWFEEAYNYVWVNILKRQEPTIKWTKNSNHHAQRIIQEVNQKARERVF